MFILNQLLGSFLVHPDWDETFKWAVRYAMLVISLGAIIYVNELKDLLEHAGGMYA